MSSIIIKPSEANKPKTVIHRSKLFKGKRTAQEVHSQFGWRKRCTLCGGPPTIKVRLMMTIADIKAKSMPYWVALCQAAIEDGQVDPQGNAKVTFIPTTYGKMICFSENLACSHHQRDLERTAAKAPSYVLVEIDRGPGADNPIVQVN